MARPVTLFTGQWADLSFDQICAKAKSFGYDGVELACWGDHFEVDKALKDKDYCKGRWEILRRTGLKALRSRRTWWAGGVRQHRRAAQEHPPAGRVGDGEAEGVRKRAARKMIDTAEGVPELIDARPEKAGFGAVVNGFHRFEHLAQHLRFPPTIRSTGRRASNDFAKRWTPILDAFDKEDVNFGLEVHRPRSRSTSPRPNEPSRRQRPQALRLQLRPVTPGLPGRRLREVHPHASASGSTTST
jgi:hypothetical protein